MTADALSSTQPGALSLKHRLFAGNAGPILVVVLVLVAVWYVAAVWMNATMQIRTFERQDVDWTVVDVVAATLSQDRPLLPAPHQIAVEMKQTIIDQPIGSRRSLVHHAWVTLSATLLGFAIGTSLGILLAVGIVHTKVLDKSLLPWVIASQTVPILAIAPMIVVVLGSMGLTGLLPKAIISSYLSFFPLVIGMVKGLRAPDLLQMDLMRTFSASRWQTFWMLRWPSALPYLFASLKVAIAISLVGAIVAELPTGAQAGLGARLLAGSYYGQTIQIWSALFTAAFLSAALVGLIALAQKLILRRMGLQP
jgi:NitT/TauT family transport system permease protein